MINELKAYSATCDNCGETYCDVHREGFTIFSDDADMIEKMDSDDWYTGYTDPEHEGKYYCPDCFKQHPDIDDKIIVELHRKKVLDEPTDKQIERMNEQ